MKLNDIIEIKPGNLISRVKVDDNGNDYLVYDNNSFHNDLTGSKLEPKKSLQVSDDKLIITKVDDFIYSSIDNKGVIVHPEQAEQIITSNYFMLIPRDETSIDKMFLKWWINESDQFKEQFSVEIQGSSVVKLSKASLMLFNIDLPEIAKQREMGEIYELANRRFALESQQAEIRRDLVMAQLKGEV